LNTSLYLHPTCSSSARVFARLKEEGLLGRVRIISLEPGSAALIDELVPSVPAIRVGNELVAVDPLEPEFVAAIVKGDNDEIARYVPHSVGEAVERFSKSFIYSSYLMVLEYVGGGALEQAIKGSFARAAVRARYMEGGLADEVLRSLPGRVDEVREAVGEYLERVVAYSYLREALMVFGGGGYTEALNPRTALLWLQAKASIGRAHLPRTAWSARSMLPKAERLVEVVKERQGRWVPRLLKEFEELRGFAEELGKAVPRSPY